MTLTVRGNKPEIYHERNVPDDVTNRRYNHMLKFFNDLSATGPEFFTFQNEIIRKSKADDLAREIKLGTPAGRAMFLAQVTTTRCFRVPEPRPLLRL